MNDLMETISARLMKCLALVCLAAFLAEPAEAATTSWWRFEAGEDTDPSLAGMSNPNEVSGEPAMISSNATIGSNAPDLFDTVVPGVGLPNTGSVRSYVNGAGGDGIYGSAAYSSTLNSTSITVEFWLRTTENEAGFVARTTDADRGEGGTLDSGFRIVDPQNLRVDYWVSRDNGSGSASNTLTSGVAVNDGEWHYVAFTYDYATGVASLNIDRTIVDTFNGTNNRRLWYGNGGGATPTVDIGYQLDGNPNNNTGTLDEIRFSDVALPPDQLLVGVVPEASTSWMIVAFGFFILGSRSWQRFQVGSLER